MQRLHYFCLLGLRPLHLLPRLRIAMLSSGLRQPACKTWVRLEEARALHMALIPPAKLSDALMLPAIFRDTLLSGRRPGGCRIWVHSPDTTAVAHLASTTLVKWSDTCTTHLTLRLPMLRCGRSMVASRTSVRWVEALAQPTPSTRTAPLRGTRKRAAEVLSPLFCGRPRMACGGLAPKPVMELVSVNPA